MKICLYKYLIFWIYWRTVLRFYFTRMRSSSYSNRTDVQRLFLNTILNMMITSGCYVETLHHSTCYWNSNNMVSIFYYIWILCFILFKPCLKITKKYKLKITHYANFLGQKEEKTNFSLSFSLSLSHTHTRTHKLIYSDSFIESVKFTNLSFVGSTLREMQMFASLQKHRSALTASNISE